MVGPISVWYFATLFTRTDFNSVDSYLVDWEYWGRPNKKTVWVDRLYISWNLAQAGPSDDLSDMSDWVL